MKRILLSLTICSLFRISAGAADVSVGPATVAPAADPIQAAKITSPEEKLYVQACLERANGDPKRAIQTVAKVMALYSGKREWMARSELLSAELYLELGMPEAADVTARQVQNLYAGMDVAKKADALRSKIKKLKKGAE
jgi:hypothetical protein